MSTVKYPPANRFPFRAGPYAPPAVKPGTTVHDEYYGDVECVGMTTTPIPWPGFHCKRGRHKGLMPILVAGLGPGRGRRGRGGRGALLGRHSLHGQ